MINKLYNSHKYMTIAYTIVVNIWLLHIHIYWQDLQHKIPKRISIPSREETEESIQLIKTGFIDRFLITYMIFFHE